MSYSRYFVPPWMVSVLLAAPAMAEFPLTEDDFYAPMPTVLSASRLSQPLTEAPVAMTVIDREMIEASSALDVAELLRLVPGFQVARKEGIDTIATYHGFADNFPRRLQVLVDGRSVYDPGVSGVVWAALPLTPNQIERIEVVRGSNAAAFGSNAVLGTINIVTRRPQDSDRLHLTVRAGGADGSAGEFSHAGAAGSLHYRLDASRSDDRGFAEKSDDSRSSTLNLRSTYRPSLDDELSFHAGMRETDFDSEAFRYPRKRLFRSDYQHLVWERVIDLDEDLRFQVYRNALEAPDVVSISPPLPITVDYSLQTYRYDAELQHRWSPAEDWRLSWGAGLRRDVVKGGLYDVDASLLRDQVRGFSNLEWRADEDWVVNLGLMVEHYEDLDTYLSPRLAANWLIDPEHTVRVGVARAYRVPTFVEQRGLITIDPTGDKLYEGTKDIDAERLDSVEIGYLHEFPAVSGSLDLRVFYNEIKPIIDDVKIIDANDETAIQEFREVGKLTVTGFEAQARIRPNDGGLLHLAYAYADVGGSRIDAVDPDGLLSVPLTPEPNEDKVPRHTLTALASQRLPDDWQISATFSYVSGMTWMGDGERVGALRRLDAKLGKRVRAADGDLRVSLNVQNLLDDGHYEFASPDVTVGNRAERRVYLQLEYLLR